MIPRQPAPPRTNEQFRQAALATDVNEVEPWADGLDEVDPRELAMGRFRARQETLSEIFSPDSISEFESSYGVFSLSSVWGGMRYGKLGDMWRCEGVTVADVPQRTLWQWSMTPGQD